MLDLFQLRYRGTGELILLDHAKEKEGGETEHDRTERDNHRLDDQISVVCMCR
jgi:hypothetical protein